jgi:hypothetical protein
VKALLTEAQARHRRNLYRLIGWPLLVLTVLGWVIGGYVSVYSRALPQPKLAPLPPYSQAYHILTWIWSWQPWGLPIGASLVRNAPRFPTPFPRTSWEAFWLILFVTASLLKDAATRLSYGLKKAQKARDEAQQHIWVNENLGRHPAGVGTDVSVHVGEVSLQMGMVPDIWSTRWYVILTITVGGGLLYTLVGQYIMRTVGWAH